MNGRFEVLTLSEAQCLIRFSDSDDMVLLASSAIPGLDLAERTIEWLRSALQKDWLYQIGRAYQGNGPMFTLSAPFGVVCSSPPFTSSDAMERAVAYIKTAAIAAPVLKLSESRDIRMPTPSEAAMRAPHVEPAAAFSRAAMRKNKTPALTESMAARSVSRES
jgi:hypothetical protein